MADAPVRMETWPRSGDDSNAVLDIMSIAAAIVAPFSVATDHPWVLPLLSCNSERARAHGWEQGGMVKGTRKRGTRAGTS